MRLMHYICRQNQFVIIKRTLQQVNGKIEGRKNYSNLFININSTFSRIVWNTRDIVLRIWPEDFNFS